LDEAVDLSYDRLLMNETIRVGIYIYIYIQGGSNMTRTNCDLFTHNQFRSYLNHLVCVCIYI
jgi:hypothetical protein